MRQEADYCLHRAESQLWISCQEAPCTLHFGGAEARRSEIEPLFLENLIQMGNGGDNIGIFLRLSSRMKIGSKVGVTDY